MKMAVALNKNSFCCIHRLLPLCIETNPRENRIFAAKASSWWAERALKMLKFLPKIRQNT